MDCVTIIIMTYKQDNLIFQTIDSVLFQKYQNIQIIIADDCSPSFDVTKIKNYIENNKRNNISLLNVIKNERNMGTVKNFNNARKFIKGKYVIPLSGDDVFYDDNVVSNYVSFFEREETRDVFVSQVIQYDYHLEKELYSCLSKKHISLLVEGNNIRLFGELCLDCFIPAVGCAYTKRVLEEFGPCDERYYLVEDWPMYLKMLRNGVHFGFANFISTKHRDGGVSNVKQNSKYEWRDNYHQDLINIIRNEIYPYYSFCETKLQKKVYTYANDRIVISEYRRYIQDKSIFQKIKWLIKQQSVIAIFWRGFLRVIKRKVGLFFNE